MQAYKVLNRVSTQSEWWIQIRSRGGRVGWTNEPEKFDGKDQFGAGAA
jgi:hypothetical protein